MPDQAAYHPLSVSSGEASLQIGLTIIGSVDCRKPIPRSTVHDEVQAFERTIRSLLGSNIVENQEGNVVRNEFGKPILVCPWNLDAAKESSIDPFANHLVCNGATQMGLSRSGGTKEDDPIRAIVPCHGDFTSSSFVFQLMKVSERTSKARFPHPGMKQHLS